MLPQRPGTLDLRQGLALLLLVAAPARAQDVVLPDFTPASIEDFGLADDLTNLARMALEDRGLQVLSGEALSERVGTAADACADDVSCPVSLWPLVPARTALVGRVGRAGNLIHIRVQVYTDRGSRASRVLDERIPPSRAGELLLLLADELAPTQAPPPTVVRPSPGVLEERYGRVRTRGEDAEKPQDERALAELDREPDADIAGLDLPRYAVERYARSGQEAEDWLEAARVRRPGLTIELRGGAAFGDIDRRYDTRVGLYDETGNAWSERNTYTYHSFLNGSGFAGGLGLGWQAAWWVDLGLAAGVQMGQKELSTGWETWQAGGGSEGEDLFLERDSVAYDPVSAVLGFLEPRVRLYPLALGPLKPFVLGGLNLRMFDGYKVPDLSFVNYPEARGGISLGPTIGAGLAFDAPKGTYGFLEVPWTWIVTPTGPVVQDDGRLEQTPAQFRGVGQFVLFTAGVGFSLR